jgi:hypothetical protein
MYQVDSVSPHPKKLKTIENRRLNKLASLYIRKECHDVRYVMAVVSQHVAKLAMKIPHPP